MGILTYCTTFFFSEGSFFCKCDERYVESLSTDQCVYPGCESCSEDALCALCTTSNCQEKGVDHKCVERGCEKCSENAVCAVCKTSDCQDKGISHKCLVSGYSCRRRTTKLPKEKSNFPAGPDFL